MILADLGVPVLSLKEAGIHADIQETGTSFEENAAIKAETICKMTGAVALADDSGLEVDYLNKEPGIYSARYMERIPPMILRMPILSAAWRAFRRKADRQIRLRHLRGVSGRTERDNQRTIEGIIGYESRGENGFGYDRFSGFPNTSAAPRSFPRS